MFELLQVICQQKAFIAAKKNENFQVKLFEILLIRQVTDSVEKLVLQVENDRVRDVNGQRFSSNSWKGSLLTYSVMILYFNQG